MSETDNVIAALRREHDQLAALVSTFTEDDLRRPSGASDWDVSQVLSHLGSGAVINLGTLQSALGEAGRADRAEDHLGPLERHEPAGAGRRVRRRRHRPRRPLRATDR